MGPVQLLLLSLLLSSGVFTQEESPDNGNPGCSKEATRFKPLRKYVYSYEAETSSGITGTADSRSGSKITCKVELEVPQLCHFILRTMHCSLRETFGVDTEGRAILKKSKNSEEFANAMSKNELKFIIQDGTKVKLYSEKDEPLNVLNLKRGIISALLVPTEGVENVKTIPMDTVYGKCDSEVEFKSRKGNVAEDISITRYLKGCDNFSPIRDHVSPIAIVKGLNSPLSTLLKSTQFCHYNIDAKKKHIRDVVCSEKHLFLPSSYKNRYGVMTEVNQTLKLEDTPKITNKNFDGDALEEKGLALESTDAKLHRQGDVVLKTLQELQKLAASQQNQQRARLFYRFVSGLRSLHNSTLGPLVPKMMETSSSVTIQALAQCGTPECYSAVLQILRTGNVSPVVADLVTYTLGLLPSPTPQRIREILNMAQYQPSRASFYGLSHSVTKFYNEKKIVTEEIADVADFMISLLGTDCSGEDELTYLTLRAIGNMGAAMEKAKPSVKSSLKTCIRNEAASLSVQKAAIQAFRKMTITEEDRSALLKAFQELDVPTDKRLASYLLVMKNPSPSDLAKILRVLTKEKNEQVKSFVASHIANILDSEELDVEDLKSRVEEALKGNQLPTAKDFRKFSQNYQISKRVSVPGIDPISAKVEGNVVFDPNSYIPKETMLKTTLHAYGFDPSDVFELGLDGKGFEPTLEALFGEKGFFPDTASKALYWVDGKVPEQVSKALFDYFGYSQDDKQDQDIMKGIVLNIEKLIKELGSKEAPEGRAYLRILGEELGYMKLNDFKLLGSLILKSVKTLQTVPEMISQAIAKGVDKDLFVHYIFMDNEFELPTGAGLQLKFALSGIATPGARVAVKLHQKSMQADLTAKPSVAVEFVTHLGINVPEFAGSGVEMNSNIFHESGIEAHVSVKAGQLKFSIPAPKTPVKLLSISNTLHLVSPAKTEEIQTLTDNQETSTSCEPFFPGLNFCTKLLYSNSTEASPYFPLTGESRFEVELVSTGEVKEYSATANYELQREGSDQIDTLKFAVQAEGVKQHEATLTFKYNRGKKILTSDVHIPDFDVDFGTNFRITDESVSGKKAYTFVLDFHNQKISEVTLTGQIRYAGVEEAMLRGTISFPRLQTELKSEALVNYSPNKAYLQISSAATIHGNSVSKRVLLRYDAEKVELEWNSGASAAVKKMSSAFPVDFSDYPKTLKKHANTLLDRKVAHTDMTLRHIVSQFIVATNTWLQKSSKDVPYAQTLQDKLSALQELDIQKLNLPVITIPEELFLKSEGRIRYNFNKNSFVIDIPLPFAGKSSDEIWMPQTVKTPPLVMESMGISVPSQEYRIPRFTVPKSYPFRVPLLGKLEVFANVYSNYYNWTAAYTVSNSTTERATAVKATYNTNADSILELLSYSVKGSGEASYNRNGFICAYENHLEHRLLTSDFKLSGRKSYEPTPAANYTLSLTASSTLGPLLSFSSDIVSEKINSMNTNNVKMEGQLEVASVFARSIYTLSTTYNEKRRVLEGKSNLKLDSSYLQATNQMSGRYSDGSLSITSVSDVQNGLLKNTASLKCENSQLKMSSETSGRYRQTAGVNNVEIILSKKMAALRSEYHATYKQIQYYALFAGSLDSQDLVFNTDISLTDQKNRVAHKSSFNVNRYGLASSATTNVQFSPLAMQSEMNAKLDTSGGSMSLSSSGRYGKNNAKFNVGGRVSLAEVTLGSEYQSTVLGMDNKHVLNFRVNREGLKFSNNLQGSFKDIKLEYTNDLNIPGLSLTFASKLDNSFSFDKFHKHVFDLQLEPGSLTAKLSNNLKYTKTEVSSKAEFLLEPLNMNLAGNVRGAHGANEIKHTYTLACAGLTAELKTDTVANVQGAAVSHRVHVDVAGLSSSVTMNTNCDSKPLRFSNTVRSTMAPFVITADIHTNANGKLVAMGEHTGDLYSKFLFKAEPLAFTFSHDYRGSTSHSLKSRGRYTTLLDNKVHMLFTPSEQSSAWKLKSQLNNNVYSQDFSSYNNPEKIGVELNGRALADLSVMDTSVMLPLTSEEINLIDVLGLRNSISEPQEFSISAFLKYDKNKDMHVISLPFVENLPVYFEKLRGTTLSTLQAVQSYLKNIDIEQHMRKYKATLDRLPQDINDYMDKLDIKGKISSMKNNFVAFTKDYRITSDDLQIMLEKAMDILQEILSQLQIYLIQIEQYIKECCEQYDIKALIVQLLEQIVETMTALDNKYQVRTTVINIIEKLRVLFRQYDLNKIGSSTLAWIKNLDDEYEITAKLQENLEQIKIQIQNIDVRSIVENLKQQIKAFDAKECLEKIKRSLPIKKINEILEQIKDFILNWIEEYEVSEKISAFRGRLHKLIVKYEIDKQVYFLIDRMIELLKQYRIKETIQKLTIYLQNIDVKSCFDKVVSFVDDAVKKVQTFDYEKMIKQVNKFLDVVIKKLKAFDYDQFVDDVNKKIQEVTQKINEELRNLELPQKAEALKQYLRDFRSVISKYMEKVKDMELAAIINWLRELIDSTTFANLKAKVNEHLEDLRERISEMDISQEFEWCLQKISQLYNSVVVYISDQWNTASKKIVVWAEEYDLKNWAENLKQFVETGFRVPEIRTVIVTIPAFEVSLRSLREATFQTPEFIVPLTDLRIPSYEINVKRLKNMKIPMKFTTPEFKILNTFQVPSFTIDLIEIKLLIVKTIDKFMSDGFQLPSIDLYLKDLKMRDMPFSDISFPEIRMPQIQIPELLIPKLNLNEFQIPEMKIPEFQFPRIPHTVTVPTFGKLSGAFRVTSPFFTLSTQAELRNTTTSANSPEFVTSISAQTTSKLDFLVFSVIADSRLLAPDMKQLNLKNAMKVNHRFLTVDHSNEVVFLGTSVEGEAETRANLHTKKNSVELQNNLMVKLQRKIWMQSGTAYSHRLNIPQADFSSQADLVNNMTTEVEAGYISFTSAGKGNWKWASPNFSDEGTHDSRATFKVEGPSITFSATNRINDKYLKVNQALRYECHSLMSATLQIQSEMESQRVGRSILNVKGTGELLGMAIELTGSHNARLHGRITGTVNNELSFLAKPSEIRLSTNNDGNVKISFPMKLTGKIDFLNNYGFALSSSVQQVHWQATGRFNQYRYSHNMSAGSNDDRIEAHVEMNGDANLDFLNIPLSIPQIQIPYTGMKTPQVKDFSLWEQVGLKEFLKTTRQSFDLNFNAQYEKNKDMHAIPLPLAKVHEVLNKNILLFNKHFEKGRNAALDFLTKSYNEAKTKLDKYKIQTSLNKIPRTLKIPGYTIPVVNIEVAPFTAEMPAFGFTLPKEISTRGFTVPIIGFSVPSYTLVVPSLELPVLHIPQDLRTLKLPRFRINSSGNHILVPAMGNVTCDFSFRSSVITLAANAGLFNQSDIVGHVSVSSSSVVDALQFKLDGSTSLTRKRGLRLATALSLSNNKYLGGNHDSIITLLKRIMEASVTTNIEVDTPVLKMNFSQELSGNTKSKPTLSSGIKLTYDFNTPKYGTSAKGEIAHRFALESLSHYISVESATTGDIDGVFYTGNAFSGSLDHEANAYLNANGARSSLKFEAHSKADGLWIMEIKELLAVEASTRRVYAVWEHIGKNYAQYTSRFTTAGTQKCKATLELAPWDISADLQIQATQPNPYLGMASVNQVAVVKISPANQKAGWKGEGQIHSLSLSHDMQLSNEKSEAKFFISGSLEGYMGFLKIIKCPISEKSLWDILKLDVTTSADRKQYLNGSASLVYTKSEDGYVFPIPVNKLTDGFTVTIPELHLKAPSPVLSTPEFSLPFTTLQVPAYTIDLRNIKVPQTLSTMPFDVHLPTLPKLRFPKVDVGADYITLEKYKMPFFELTIPEYQITVSQFTLPKSVSIGSFSVDLDEVANKIADFELPTITIPEQRIEIPPLKISLPAGIYIPSFGALTGSFKIASPVYNVTWKTDLINKKDSFEHSIDSTCSSTLQFLEYDLSVVSNFEYKENVFVMKTTGSFSHRDLSANYKEVLTLSGIRDTEDIMSLDIISPTFTDVHVRYQENAKKSFGSISSPSAGTLAYIVEQDGEVLVARVYYQPQSAPQKDIDIVKGEISLKEPEQIQMKLNWNEDAAKDLLLGLKERVPKMTNAVYGYVNRYHKEYMGLEIGAATLKMKNIMQNNAEKAYTFAAKQIDEIDAQLRTAANEASDKYQELKFKAKRLYRRAADQAEQFDYQRIKTKLLEVLIAVIEEYHQKIKHVIDSATEFLKTTKFQVPGLSEKYSGAEIYRMTTEKVAKSADLCLSKLQEYFDALIAAINELEVRLPASETILRGRNVLDQIKEMLKDLQDKIRQTFATLQEADFAGRLKQLKQVVQQVFQKVEEMVRSLQSKNFEDIKAQTQQLYKAAMASDFAQKLRSLTKDVKKYIAQFKDFSQKTIQNLSEKLHQLLIYVKSLREEYFDPTTLGLSAKYYEVEDKVLGWLKEMIDLLVDWHKSFVGDLANSVARLTDQARELVEIYSQEYYDLITDAEGKGRQKIMELSSAAQEKIRYWSAAAKRKIDEHNKQLKEKLREIYGQLSQSQEKLISVAKRLIDLTAENYSAFLQYISELLRWLEQVTAESVKPYVTVGQGELRIKVPM